MDIGVHCLDTLRFLLGDVSEMQAILCPPPTEQSVESSAEIALQFNSGALGNVFCSYHIPYHSRLELMGERGRAHLEPFTLAWADVEAHLETRDGVTRVELNTGNIYGELLEAFSRAVRGLQPVPIPGEEGLANQRLIDAAYSGRSHI